ncbi:MAG: hypothetical protein ACLRMZ_26865 [Blautia marasmi]
MKEAIYSWIKCLAIFYILLTMLIHLVPTGNIPMCVFLWAFADGYADHSHASILEKAKTLPESFFQPLPAGGKSGSLLIWKISEKPSGKSVEEQLEKIFRNL